MRQSRILRHGLTVGMCVAAALAQAQAPAGGGGRGRGGGGAAAGPVDISQSRTMDQAAIDRGSALFAEKCASCHGANARGGSKTKTDVDLIRSPMVLDDLGTGGREIADYLKYGRPEKNMPKFDLTDSQSFDIAAWLHRQVSAAAERGTYQRLNVFSGDAKAGEAYFNGAGKCSTCHSAAGDMKGLVAKNGDDASTIQGMIVSGGGRGGRGGGGRGATAATPSPTAVTAKVTLKTGEVVNGYPASIDDWQITIRTTDGQLRSFLRDKDGVWPKYETHNPLQAHVDLQFRITDDDIHNLAAYLRTLN